MITKQELADGIRFAGQRAAAAAEHVKDWDYQLAHQWTARDAFTHVAATAGGLEGFFGMIGDDSLNGLNVEAIAAGNANTIASFDGKSPADLIQMILDGANASAAFIETVDDDALAKVVSLGGYEMPRAEIVAQIWIHHQIAHAYEGSARWPLA